MTPLLRRVLGVGVAVVTATVGMVAATPGTAAARGHHQHPLIRTETHHDHSIALRDMPAAPLRQGEGENEPIRQMPNRGHGVHTDPVVQTTLGPNAPTTGASFDGIGQGFTGPSGTFTVSGAPPDTNAAVGSTQVVEIVNTAFAVFSKTGTALFGPAATNTLFSGFGGACQTTNDGDGVVRYDALANRWIITQFANVQTGGPFFECIAVSQTSDATGSWNRYSFQYASFPDYPKLSVWPDAYYVTYNLFNASGTTFQGAQDCAMNRAAMLAGTTATQQCFNTSTSFGGLLGADFEGGTAPPAGEANTVIALGTTATTLASWKFHVDFTTPANSTFTGPTNITVASYTPACGSTGTCIPQSGTTQQLDSLSDRVMFRLAYRNFGDHESLVTNDAVTSGSSVGVRWYELRNVSGTPTVFQQSTFAPDSTFRWMGSLAMDKVGNIGLGYSASSSSIHPQIRITGRLAGDAAGTMTQGETTIVAGAGSQTGGLSRWGDYSSMVVDPVDGCTFWYAQQYIPSNGSFNWKTHLNAFTLPGCTTAGGNDFSISVSPNAGTVTAGNGTTATVSTAVTSGSAESVSLSASGLPTGATASFSPTSVTAGGSSTLTLSTSASTPAGTYPITITGTAASATHNTTYTLTVNAVVGNDFSISVSPNAGTVTAGSGTTATVSTAVTSGSAQTVSLSASGLPTGATASFSPTSVTAGGSSTLTLNTSASTPAGTYPITITGTAASGSHNTTYTLTVNGTGGCTNPGQKVVNGGFESGNTPWTATAGVLGNANGSSGESAHTGTHFAWLDGYGRTHTDTLSQASLVLPAGCSSYSLTFWLHIDTAETTTTTQFDKLTVALNTTTVATFSNLDHATGYQLRTVNVAAFAGQTVTLKFTGTEDVSLQTSFVLDDIALTVS